MNTNAASTVLHIRLLGSFRLTTGDPAGERPLPRRLQVLVALLTLQAGVPQRRERIAELFWPEASENQAHGSMRKMLFDLRHLVPEVEPMMLVDRTSVCWAPAGPWTLDVRVFEKAAQRANDLAALAHAIQLYYGELLPHCYDDWIIPQRERLRRLYLDLLRRATDLAERRHEYTEAIEYADRLLQEEPLLEEQYRVLMRLNALAGNRAAALRTYHLCATALQRELGVEPGAATREAYELLVRPQFGAIGQPQFGAIGQPQSGEVGQAQLENVGRNVDSAPHPSPATIPLTGRQSEWTALLAAWHSAASGRAAVLLVSGEPGAGKTRLLEELLDWSEHQGIPNMYTRCYAAEGTLAFAPVATLLRSCLSDSQFGAGDWLSALEPVWMAEIARLVPELVEKYPDVPAPGPLTESWQRTRLFEALARMLLGRQPLLLVVDDIQWADGDTIDWLHFVVRWRPDARFLLVCASRPDGVSAVVARDALWPDLRITGRMGEIDLGPLERAATIELAVKAGGPVDEERAGYIWTETEGNPLFVIEMMRVEQPDVLPTSIRTVLNARLAQLSPAARRLAGTASVVGRAFQLSVLLEAEQQEEGACLRALDELWSYRIIREHGIDGYDFSHDKLRRVAYDSLPLPRRRLLHQRIAEALARQQGPNIDAGSASIAAHYEAAGCEREAGPHYLRAGDAAWRVFATGAAIDHYQRALELLPVEESLQVIPKLGELLPFAGRLQDARTLLSQGITLAGERGDALAGARCRQFLAVVQRISGAYVEAEEQFLLARDELEALGEDVLLSNTLAHLAAMYVEQGAYQRALSLLHEALRIAEQTGDERTLANAVGTLAVLHFYQLDLDNAEMYFSRLLTLPGSAPDLRRRGAAQANLGLIRVERGEYASALDLLREAFGTLHTAGEEILAPTTILNMSVAYRKLGDFERAERCCAVSAHMVSQAGYWHLVHIALAHFGHMAAIAGRIAEADRLLTTAPEPMREQHLSFHLCEALYFLADLRERQGELEAALETATEAVRVAQEIGRHDYAFVGELLATNLRFRLGRIDLETALARLIEMQTDLPQPHRQALLAHARWRLDPIRTDDQRLATELYGEIYPNRPNHLYRERYRELTSVDLPAPDIPELLGFVREYPGKTEDLIAEVESAVAQHRQVFSSELRRKPAN